MKKQTHTHGGRSFPILMLFCGAVVMLILISFFVKMAAVVAKSGFDGKHRFTVLVVSKESQLMSFAPDANTISVLHIPASTNLTKEQVSKTLRVPIDGMVDEKSSESITFEGNMKDAVERYTQHLLFSYPQKKTDLTVVDAFRMWLFARSMESHTVFDDTLGASVEAVEPAAADKLVGRLFVDETVSEENVGIQVINASGVSGAGNSFAQIITNIGGNVAAVSTAHKNEKKTKITYTGEMAYTVKKMEKMLKVKAQQVKKQDMFGIIVTIGSDTVSLIQ